MANIDRIRVALAGFPGAPGVMTFYSIDGPGFLNPLHAYLTVAAQNMPPNVHLQILGEGDTINDVNGDLITAWVGAEPDDIVGTGGPNYSAPTGILQHWLTATVLDGHRVKGSTFIVPTTRDLFEADGTPSAANIAQMVTAAAALLTATSPNFVVWHRQIGRAHV